MVEASRGRKPVLPAEREFAAALERVAEAAEDGIVLQGRVAAEARGMARGARLQAGSGAASNRVRDVLDLLGSGTDRLVTAAAELRRAWAAALAAEGLSGRQIADRLGVSHQRVSVLLGRAAAPRTSGS